MVVSAALGEALSVYIGSVGRLTSQRWRPLSHQRPLSAERTSSRSPLAVIRAGSPPRCPLATVHAESSVMATFSVPQLKSSSTTALPPKSPLREVRLVGSAPPQLSDSAGAAHQRRGNRPDRRERRARHDHRYADHDEDDRPEAPQVTEGLLVEIPLLGCQRDRAGGDEGEAPEEEPTVERHGTLVLWACL